LEAASVRQAQELFGENRHTDRLYREDIEAYRSIQALFLLSPAERLDCSVRFNPDALLVTVTRKWVNDRSGRIDEIISLNFNCGEEENWVVSGTVAIVPAVLQLAVSEYYLDVLDALIVEACQEPRTIKDLLTELQECFDAADIEADYPGYARLIEDCIKRLLFAGVLVTYYS
jgi:hypothetical protein